MYVMKEKQGLKQNQQLNLETPRVCSSVPSVHSATQRAEFTACAPALPSAVQNWAATQTPGRGCFWTHQIPTRNNQRLVSFINPEPPDMARGSFPDCRRSSRQILGAATQSPKLLLASANYLPFFVAALTHSLFSSPRALLCCLTVLTAHLKVLSIFFLWFY